MTDQETSIIFLKELDREIGWQWKWEKRYRRLVFAMNWATWVVRLLILAIATFQVSQISQGSISAWVVFSTGLLSVLNIGIPMILTTFRYQQRQEVYDSHAREYSAIRIHSQLGKLICLLQFKCSLRYNVNQLKF